MAVTSIGYHNTWIEIDRNAIQKNIFFIKKSLHPTTKILAVLKANAYGLGIKEVADLMAQNGITWIGVSTVAEAVELRMSFPQSEILILGPSFLSSIETIVQYELKPAVYSVDYLTLLNQEALKQNKIIKVHLMVDTGMGRIGIWHDKELSFFKKILSFKHIELEGVCSHFADADKDFDFTRLQHRRFLDFVLKLELYGLNPKVLHICNSSGMLRHKEAHHDLVRIGLLLYGISPIEGQKINELTPAISLKTKIAFLKDVEPGRTISYGRKYIAQKHTKIATLPIGYSHSYNRNLSNKGYVLIHEKRCPVIGTITMDQMMVDVGHVPDVHIDDEVVIIGQQGASSITWEEISQAVGTVPYELLCNLSSKCHRIYT